MATNASAQDQQQIELSDLCEARTSSINQIAISATSNSLTRVSGSSNSDGWSTSDGEDHEKQVAEMRPRALTDDKVQVINRYTDCTNVSSTVHNTNIYKDGVTVNNNYYCCPSSIDYVVNLCRKRRRIIIVTLSVLVILLIIFLCVWLLYPRTSKSSKDVEIETTSIIPTSEEIPQSITTTIIPSVSTDSTTISTTISTSSDSSNNTNHEWTIISRDEWGAEQPKYVVGKLTPLPPTYVILSETETDECTTTDKCMKIVRDIQALALEDFLKPDLVYSFLIGGDGMAYEGRGWDVHAVDMERYDTEYFDHISIGISFIGNFKNAVPTETVLQAAKALLEFGVQAGKLAEDYKLKCVRQLSCTSKNPGDKLYNVIEMWERWDNRTIEHFPPIDCDY